MNLNQHQ